MIRIAFIIALSEWMSRWEKQLSVLVHELSVLIHE
jgi:hypothetical protein